MTKYQHSRYNIGIFKFPENMKIHLPNSAFIGNINQFLRDIDFSNPDKLEITANDKWISIHPVVLSMIAALGLPIEPKDITCPKMTAVSAHYLERMGLFKFLEIKSGIQIKEHESAGRFIPLKQIKKSEELSKFITDVIPLLHLEPEHANAIKYVVSELVRNVLEHAKSDIGAIVSAQYHKKSNMIRIGIVDTGVGIKKTISRSHKVKTDLDAIQLALTPGITGTTPKEGGTEQNAGAGLFFIKSIAKVNGTYFMIYSGNALYKLLKSKTTKLYADPFDDRHTKSEEFSVWPGTAVGVDISLDNTPEFSNLLRLIRNIYSKTVRERKKARYKKPKFI